MRLILKITLLYGLIALIVFLIGAYINFRVMSREIDKEQRFYIEERLEKVIERIERRPPTSEWVRDKLKVTPLPELVPDGKPQYSDTLVMHSGLQRIEPHIKLELIKNINDHSYKIMLYDLIVESDDIEDAVRESMIKTYLILMIAVIVLGFIVSYFFFKPFYQTLEVIRSFSIKDNRPFKLDKPTTWEFRKLNQFIEDMGQKVKQDYQSLKEFSENASHEIQTPLAIAQGKLELLMSTSDLTEEQLGLITSAQSSLRRLSKLSLSLGLLTKIDNQEFSDLGTVDLSKITKSILAEYKELIELKELSLEVEIEEQITVTGNVALLEIMISNLLTNAVKHNTKEGFIYVKLNSHQLVIENSGEPLNAPASELFGRFKKGSDNPDSWGLGLSIVKKIVDQHGFEINYSTQEQKHFVVVAFKES
ncbi:HAMP domain-containing sensor histidine kinase [Marinoscillum sp. MHG1-6]|uniref:sensor histidine kinase n=1 Tax=Marinoscillum sp. MHG1-6 TaxID=2959627 RepID=UPI00215739E5|nr:HAMP domain-containing sensor histidine kinase [Marinoscillum sp. MHG1-6]